MPQGTAFHTAVREAIEARGLTLARVCDRLTELGAPLSVPTLSNWQRGSTRPDGPRSQHALSVLENVLELRPGTLSQFLEAPATSDAPNDVRPDFCQARLRQASAQLGLDQHTNLAVLSVIDDVIVEPRGWRYHRRMVIRALRSGTHTRPASFQSTTNSLPTFQPGPGAARGRTVIDPDLGFMISELLLPYLVRGETTTVEYTYTSEMSDNFHGSWFQGPGKRYELTVRLAPGTSTRSAHRITCPSPQKPAKDICEIRLIGGTTAYMMEPDAASGFHGIRLQ